MSECRKDAGEGKCWEYVRVFVCKGVREKLGSKCVCVCVCEG